MDFSPDQERAISGIVDWYHSGAENGVSFLSGPAGSGKTTVAREILSRLGIAQRTVLAAPTGKAAFRLRLSTGLATMSCHQLTRHPVDETPSGSPIFAPKIWRDGGCKLILVDEGSMVPFDIAKSLLTFQQHDDGPYIPVIVMGDPYQLPPVESGYTLLDCRKAAPHYMLETIHRQGADSDILTLATGIRDGSLKTMETIGNGNQVKVLDTSFDKLLARGKAKAYVDQGVQFLVHYRRTAEAINNYCRLACGYQSNDFDVGDRIMTLTNNWMIDVQNGAEFIIKRKQETPEETGVYSLALQSIDTDEYRYLPLARAPGNRYMREYVDVARSYACTVHKYQGSEADLVCVVNERHPSDNEEHRRKWLYTAVTRARSQLVVLGGGAI